MIFDTQLKTAPLLKLKAHSSNTHVIRIAMDNVPQKRFLAKIISSLKSSDFLWLIMSSNSLGDYHLTEGKTTQFNPVG